MNTRSTDGRRAGQTPYQLFAIKPFVKTQAMLLLLEGRYCKALRLDGIDICRWLDEESKLHTVLLEISVQRIKKMNTRSTDGRRAGQTPYQLFAIK
uniref:Uncharacterized protein n=1 Tax=Tanacetum cinerariifolium TaxID=118510 RepID=A0A6L2NUF3_TANCI|nr:hypothetical protein [Tanacetum cinerariifolium]